MNGKLGGRYQIIKELGQGGFGKTYIAEDTHLPGNPQCVVKQLLSGKPSEFDLRLRLFNTEAQILYKLGEHDRIPKLLAHFDEQQNFYLVQQLIQGDTLSQEIRAGQRWSEVQVIELLEDILTPLAFVHQNQVIHRDLKPANLIRRKPDGKIVLIDFGAVKEIMSQSVAAGSRPTIGIGTPGYMPIEQEMGHPTLGSDVYAVGMIAIQALTGLDPSQLTDSNTGEVTRHHRVQINPKLVRILDKMVRADFRQRYPSAEQALQAVISLKPQQKRVVTPQIIATVVTVLLAIAIVVAILTRTINLQPSQEQTSPAPNKEIPAF
jgi:serine/threonine protein kinase